MKRITLAMVLLVAAISASPALAQDARLVSRLGAAIAADVDRIVSDAKGRELPTEPLIQKALEGAAKGAAPDRIVVAVRRLLERLETARQAVGDVSEADLVSAAAALEAGATPASLARLGASRPEGTALAPACLTLTFLLAKGVPADNAADVVSELLTARMRDSDFLLLQRLVEQDVRAGAPALEAARVRARGLIPRSGGRWP